MRKLARYFSQVLAWFYQFLPRQIDLIWSWCIAILWVDILRLRRQVVFENIDRAFKNPPLDTQTKLKWMRESIAVLGRGVVDNLRIPYLTEPWIRDHVIFHGLEHIKADRAHLMMAIHMGSMDLTAAIISKKVIPLSIISKRFKNQFMDEFWFHLRQQSESEFINAHGVQNAFQIFKALKQKKGVVFVIDQFMGKPYGVETKFFGISTGTAYGLALFAKKSKAPVIPTYSYWDQDHKLHIIFDPPIDISDIASENQEEENRMIMQRMNDHVEKMIQVCPSQWMWVHRRWKDFE